MRCACSTLAWRSRSRPSPTGSSRWPLACSRTWSRPSSGWRASRTSTWSAGCVTRRRSPRSSGGPASATRAAWRWCSPSGASGYLLKEDGVDEAARAIHAAASGTIVLTRSAAALLGRRPRSGARACPGARGADPRHGDPDGGGHDREGAVPGEHLARAPDTRDRRQGHRARAEEPERERRGARRVPRAAAVVARPADRAGRRDHRRSPSSSGARSSCTSSTPTWRR